MSLKENLRKKAMVDRLAQSVTASIGPVSGGYKIDKDAMRELLGMAGYESLVRRGLEMYARDFSTEKSRIVLLDNELKIYDTGVEDVVVRKNPTLGEMVKIRNIRRILTDQDVVVAARMETVRVIRNEIMETIDLSYTVSDIKALYREGADALDSGKSEIMAEVLWVFSEMLNFCPPPVSPSGDIVVYGRKNEKADDFSYAPLYLYSLSDNVLNRYDVIFPAADSKNPGAYKTLATGKTEPVAEGMEVLDELREKAMALPEKRVSP